MCCKNQGRVRPLTCFYIIYNIYNATYISDIYNATYIYGICAAADQVCLHVEGEEGCAVVQLTGQHPDAKQRGALANLTVDIVR